MDMIINSSSVAGSGLTFRVGLNGAGSSDTELYNGNGNYVEIQAEVTGGHVLSLTPQVYYSSVCDGSGTTSEYSNASLGQQVFSNVPADVTLRISRTSTAFVFSYDDGSGMTEIGYVDTGAAIPTICFGEPGVGEVFFNQVNGTEDISISNWLTNGATVQWFEGN
jgi:hypothetical protein